MAMARTRAPLPAEFSEVRTITPLLPPFYVQYNGLSASHHYMDALTLGVSLQGVSRILRVSTHFALYREYAADSRSSDIRIIASPPNPGSLWFELFPLFATQYPLLQHIDAQLLWDMIDTLVQAILFRNGGNNHLYERLMDSLDKQNELWAEAVNKQNETWKEMHRIQAKLHAEVIKKISRSHRKTQKDLRKIVRNLIDSNQLSAAKVVSPVGVSCNRMRVGDEPHDDEENDEYSINEMTAGHIRSAQDSKILPEHEYSILLDGVSLGTGACKFTIEGEGSHLVRGKIIDPVFLQPNNPYTDALNTRTALKVRAKLEMRKNKPYMYHISNTVE